jgi:hypothetical protein
MALRKHFEADDMAQRVNCPDAWSGRAGGHHLIKRGEAFTIRIEPAH